MIPIRKLMSVEVPYRCECLFEWKVVCFGLEPQESLLYPVSALL